MSIILRPNLRKIIYIIFIISFGSKLYSRLDEIKAFLNLGYFLMRQAEGEATPVLLSMLNIMFYPVAITIVVSDNGTNLFRKFVYLTIFTISVVDIVFLGTRNVPLFIFLLIFVFRMRIGRREIFWLISAAVLFLFAFSYTTSNRTQEAYDGVFNWAYLFKWTISSQIVNPNIQLMEQLSGMVGDWIWPVLFLMQYISHSIAELSFQLTHSEFTYLPSFVYLIDQVCIVGCSGNEVDAIFLINSRAGSYQTIISSLIFDFGYIIPIVVSITLVAIHLSLRREGLRIRMNWGVQIYIMFIISLAPIENYLYNGLGLVQNALMLISLAFTIKEFPKCE